MSSYLLLSILSAASIFLPVRFSFAADLTWTGAASADWATNANWSTNSVPTSADNVTIPDASTTANDPSISVGAVARNVVIAAAGILNGNANVVSVYGGWTNSGTFNHGNGTISFRGSINTTFTPGANDYFDMILDKAGYDDVAVSGTATVLGNLTQTDGELYGGQINLAGNYIIGAGSNGSSTYGSSTVINLNGTGDQSIIYSAGGTGAQIRIDKSAGTLAISDDIVVCGWNYVQGSVSGLDAHTLIFGDDYNGSFTPGSLNYSSIELKKTGYDTISISGTGIVTGNLIHTTGEFMGGQLNLGGNYVVASGAEGGSIYGTSTIINFNSAGDQTIIYSPGGVAAQVRIDKTSGAFAVNDDIVVCGWTYVQGTVSGLDIYTLIFGDNYNGSFTPGSLTYGNVELNKTYYDNLAVSGTATIAGNLTHTNGQFGGGQINLAGDYIIGASAKGGADSSTPTVVNLNSIGDQQIIYSAGGNGTAVRIDKPSGTLAVPGTVSVSGWSYVQGAVTGADSCILKLGGVFHNSFLPGSLIYHDIEIRENGGYSQFTISGNLDMNGDLTFYQGNLRFDSYDPDINLVGNLYIAAGTTFTRGTGTLTFTGTAPSTFTDLSVTPQNIGKVAISKTNADSSQNTLALLSAMTVDTLTVNADNTLDLGSGNHILTLANAGSTANVLTVTGVLDAGDGTVRFSATNSAGSINLPFASYENLETAGTETYLLTADTDIDGDLSIGAGSTLDTAGYDVDLAGDLTIEGNFNSRTSAFILDGDDQSITGGAVFYDLSKTVSQAATLSFQQGSDTVVTHLLTLKGGDRDHRLSLRSSALDSIWNLSVDPAAAYDFDFLDVQDSVATRSLTVLNSIDSGNNLNWTIINNTAPAIAVPTLTINGNTVTIRTTADDTDHDAISIKVEYSLDGGATWHDPYLASVSSDQGAALDNSQSYQVINIDTFASNQLDISWDTKDLRNALGSILFEEQARIRLTPYDNTDYGNSQLSAIFIIDNRSAPVLIPSGPDFSNITLSVSGTTLILSDLPASVTQLAISSTPDFSASSFQDISPRIDISSYPATLYLKFRTSQGATSDTIVYSSNSNLQEGDIVKIPSSFDVYIIKYKNSKQYKRLILSPSVFSSYQHLQWENLKVISPEQLDSYQTSSLVWVEGDSNIYVLTPQGDTGQRRILRDGEAYDPDSVYEINGADRDSYQQID